MEHVMWQVEEGVAIVTLTRPPANALSRGVMAELNEVFENVYKDNEIKAVVFHGEGRFFAAGADIKEFTEVKNEQEFAQLGQIGQETFTKIEQSPKPVIAAIHGAALGGGLELALACHIRLAAKGTKLGLPELNLGLIPGFGGTQRLPKLIGKAKAIELMLTSEPMTAEEGYLVGLINHVLPEEDVLSAARSMATVIAGKSPLTVQKTLELVEFSDSKLEVGLEKERAAFGDVFKQEDRHEGVQAFLEKRKPVFKGN
ncbi:enoyl-CoA hydratase [Shouchella lehensis]|uniref:Enoyl-CoA hydratase n=1 Tax=Shouchella lehensis G1 TaxID=1246626 RepID=A0A060LYH2_9BACI|nr:enoyl-CoA hydratase [Shouchella lehensis]AIC95227.1 enoyl-CoA hydratase [Shouchella lehensis G1]